MKSLTLWPKIVLNPADRASRKPWAAAGNRERVPRLCTLDGFVEGMEGTSGVNVSELDPLTVLHIETYNSVYRVIVRRPSQRDVLIQGGRCFLSPTEARLSGSTLGGSFLKVGWIALGLSVELHCDDARIITSPVREIHVEKNAPEVDAPAKVG